ncbi:MAG: hypothetical protein MJA27_34015 [Pseudanabaenales cyanobacterium]|nr:hypothetical protein [Pseudanabaenales cyanobacterium]
MLNDSYSQNGKTAAFQDYSKDLTIEQRTNKLKKASADYLRGAITEDQLEKLEEDLETDYGEIALSMASPGKTLWLSFLNLIRGKKG